MPKRSSKKAAEAGQVQLPAPEIPAAEQALAEPAPEGKNPAAVALGKLGGKKGGPARAARLTKKQRSEIARKAAQARWKRKD
jgi:hypothetical protein